MRLIKKAQITGEVLIYILAIIVFSLTLLYGYKAVHYFVSRGNEISYIQFENELKAEVERAQADTRGSIVKRVFLVPGDYKQVCFVNSFKSISKPTSGEWSTGYNLVDDHLKNADDANVFLVPPGNVYFLLPNIEVFDDTRDTNKEKFTCIDMSGGKITLKLESLGNHIKISKWV